MTAPRPLAELFALTPVDMLRHCDGSVIAGHFDEDLADRANELGLSTEDQQSLRQIAHILIAVTAAQRDAGAAAAFEDVAKRLEAERWMNYLHLNLIGSRENLALPLQLAACHLLEQWAFEDARRLGMLLKVSFCTWLAAALAVAPPKGQSDAHAAL
jgi:hypothetical protein